MDKFHEQLLKTEKSGLYRVLSVYAYICIFLTVMTAGVAMSGALAWFLITAIFGGSYILVRILRDKQYREYEYIFTNGNLQIDVIFNMKKRKTLVDVDIKDLEEFGLESEIKIPNGAKKLICHPWNSKGETYTMILNQNGKQAAVIQPNEEVLKLIKLYNVRRAR